MPGLQIFLQEQRNFLFFFHCSKIIQQSLTPDFVHLKGPLKKVSKKLGLFFGCRPDIDPQAFLVVAVLPPFLPLHSPDDIFLLLCTISWSRYTTCYLIRKRQKWFEYNRPKIRFSNKQITFTTLDMRTKFLDIGLFEWCRISSLCRMKTNFKSFSFLCLDQLQVISLLWPQPHFCCPSLSPLTPPRLAPRD